MKKSSIPGPVEVRNLMTGIGQTEEAIEEAGDRRRLRMGQLIPQSAEKALPPGVRGVEPSESTNTTPQGIQEKADRLRFADERNQPVMVKPTVY